MFEIGDRVKLKASAITSEWTRNQVGGKIGTVVEFEPSESMFDVAVKFEGTSRIGGMFAFDSVDLEKV